ncbi:hypothetical protein GCK32_004209 [Trichostrongylus colubriformis]|uniref:Uncharacterized protein n=1 Tax=Trichostrongylus colubriformis TaxID=6319 RepID=A0AAN8ITR3_TRICO
MKPSKVRAEWFLHISIHGSLWKLRERKNAGKMSQGLSYNLISVLARLFNIVFLAQSTDARAQMPLSIS